MKFLVDAQLPPALARWLRESGYDAAHVEEVGLREAEDRLIWEHTLKSRAILITKDEDFAARSANSIAAPNVVWLRVGNSTNHALRLWIEPRWAGVVQLLGEGHRLIEVR